MAAEYLSRSESNTFCKKQDTPRILSVLSNFLCPYRVALRKESGKSWNKVLTDTMFDFTKGERASWKLEGWCRCTFRSGTVLHVGCNKILCGEVFIWKHFFLNGVNVFIWGFSAGKTFVCILGSKLQPIEFSRRSFQVIHLLLIISYWKTPVHKM